MKYKTINTLIILATLLCFSLNANAASRDTKLRADRVLTVSQKIENGELLFEAVVRRRIKNDHRRVKFSIPTDAPIEDILRVIQCYNILKNLYEIPNAYSFIRMNGMADSLLDGAGNHWNLVFESGEGSCTYSN